MLQNFFARKINFGEPLIWLGEITSSRALECSVCWGSSKFFGDVCTYWRHDQSWWALIGSLSGFMFCLAQLQHLAREFLKGRLADWTMTLVVPRPKGHLRTLKGHFSRSNTKLFKFHFVLLPYHFHSSYLLLLFVLLVSCIFLLSYCAFMWNHVSWNPCFHSHLFALIQRSIIMLLFAHAYLLSGLILFLNLCFCLIILWLKTLTFVLILLYFLIGIMLCS